MIARIFRAAGIALWLASATPAAAQSWTRNGDRLDFDLAHISLPYNPGVTHYYETREFSHRGTGLDTAAEFKSPDEAVFATVYAYLPTLAHPVLAAVATDWSIVSTSRSPVSRGLDAVRTAGGRPQAALETRYLHYRGNLASRAAFLRVDRWLVKVRVSGPESREAEVDATMAAILDGISFSAKATVTAAVPFASEPCSSAPRAEAKLLPESSAVTIEDAFFMAMDATAPLSGKGKARGMPARIGGHWCRADVAVGDQHFPLLAATDLPSGTGGGDRTVMLLLYNDAGGAIEIIRTGRRYVLLNHNIAEVTLLGAFDSLPSESQLVRLLTGADPAGKVRARMELKPNGDSQLFVPPPPGTPKRGGPAGTTPKPTGKEI